MHQPKLGNMNANVCKCCGVLASVAGLPLIKTDQHMHRFACNYHYCLFCHKYLTLENNHLQQVSSLWAPCKHRLQIFIRAI